MLSKLITLSNLVRGTTEDLPSQINHVWTVGMLASMGLVISLVQYVGDPIQCWCPAHMPEVHCNYTKAMCWIKENYYVDFSQDIPKDPEHRTEEVVTYYPWAPWILFFMAAMFKMPHFLWTGFSALSDLDLEAFVESADEDGDVVELATILRIWIYQAKMRRKYPFHGVKKFLGAIGIFPLGRHKQTFLTGLAIFVKLYYLAVSLCMFYSLKVFIDHDFLAYGYDTLRDFLNGIVTESSRFPKNTICDIRVRQMNNVNTYSVQCILPINLYNEKIFLFLWYWYVLLIITNTYSVMHWAFNLLSPWRQWKFVNDYVIIMDHIEKKKKILEMCGLGSVCSCTPTPSGSGNSESGGVSGLHFGGCSNDNYNDNNVNNDDDEIDGVNKDSSDDDANLLSIGYNTDGTRLRVGNHVNFIQEKSSPFRNRKRKRRMRRRRKSSDGGNFLFSSVDMATADIAEMLEKRRLYGLTVWMYRQFDYDGVLVFRTLEMAVGVVLANDVFSELCRQMVEADHHSKH